MVAVRAEEIAETGAEEETDKKLTFAKLFKKVKEINKCYNLNGPNTEKRRKAEIEVLRTEEVP